jgi:hypothetical protein
MRNGERVMTFQTMLAWVRNMLASAAGILAVSGVLKMQQMRALAEIRGGVGQVGRSKC